MTGGILQFIATIIIRGVGNMMWNKRNFAFFLVIIVFYINAIEVKAAGTARNRRKNGNPQSRSVRVMNKSGVRIDIFWIHPHTRELAPSHTDGEGVMYGGETGISSYIGHEFEVVELPSKKTKKCLEKECRKTYFAVNTKEDQCKLNIRRNDSFFYCPFPLIRVGMYRFVFFTSRRDYG